MSFSDDLSRREALALGFSAGLAIALKRFSRLGVEGAQPSSLIQKAIPSSGERIPIVGIGTARRYESAATEAELAPLRETLKQFVDLGGRVLDTAPAYGSAESVVGGLIDAARTRDRFFIATKVSARGGNVDAARAQMEESLRRLHTDRIDLMQVWNMSSPDVLIPLIEEWKARGKVRYVGVTTSSDRQYAALEELMKARKLDFVQVDYAIDNRGAAERILPLAQDRGMAVLINLPFGRTRVFQNVRTLPLPEWAREIDVASWPQLFLKYIVSHPAVTCVIPGMAKPEYVVDNLGAARGRLPDAAMRKRIEQYFDSLS